MKQYHSQFGEDELLGRLFPRSDGTCVEVGAHNGIDLSNTFFFETLGWRCILVEPNPALCDEIRRLRKSYLFQCAVSSEAGEAQLHLGEGSSDVYSSLEKNSESATQARVLTVSTRTLDSILEESGITDLDFVSIDIEGHEVHALKGFTLKRWKPRIVLLEDNSDLADQAVVKTMTQNGYRRFYRSGANDWYAPTSESKIRLLRNMRGGSAFQWRGVLKIIMPAWLIRPVLKIKRSLG